MAGLAVWRGGSLTQLTWPRPTARVTWTEKKTERICRSCTRLPVHDGRGSSWALQQDEAAIRAPAAGRYTQRGPAGGQSLRRDDGAGSRTDARRIRRDDPKAADHDRDPLASHHFRRFR